MQQVAVMTIKSNGQSKDTVVNTLIKQRHQLLSVIFLLTGDADATVEAATEAVDASHAATPFFDLWMTAWARRLVIARALQAVKQQMATSIARHAKPSGEDLAKPCSLPSPRWSVAEEVTGVHLQRALLAIDIFPRCALILSVFE